MTNEIANKLFEDAVREILDILPPQKEREFPLTAQIREICSNAAWEAANLRGTE